MLDFIEDHPLLSLIAFIVLCDSVVDVVRILCSGAAMPGDTIGIILVAMCIFLAIWVDHRMWVKGGCQPRETYDQGGFPDGDWDVVYAGHGEWVVVQNKVGCGRWATEAEARMMARVYNSGR